MPKIYTLDTPLEFDGMTIGHINIFRTDFEVRRDNPTFDPKIDIYLAACDANGTELLSHNEQGKLQPVGSTFEQIKFDATSQAIRDAYKALLQTIYEHLQINGKLSAGQIQDV